MGMLLNGCEISEFPSRTIKPLQRNDFSSNRHAIPAVGPGHDLLRKIGIPRIMA
jgi:hypothetical protein